MLREHGSGTLEAIEKALHQQHITLGELNVSIYLGSTEAIKLFVKETDCLCILSKYAVTTELQNGTLRALQVENLCFKRQLCFVQVCPSARPSITAGEPLHRFCLQAGPIASQWLLATGQNDC